MRARLLLGAALGGLLAIGGLSGAFEGLAATAPPCATAQPAVARDLALSVDGVERDVRLHAPRAAAGRRQALLVALPGAWGHGRLLESATGLSRLADREGFAVAYVDPLHGRWAAHTDAPRGKDDVAFIGAAIDTVSHARCIGRGHVWLAGVSNGAGEAARAACELADRVSAVVLVAGVYRSLPPCHAAHPVSVFEIHGTADRVAPYRSGGGVPAFLSAWRTRDACLLPGAHVRIDPETVQATWRCAANTRVAQLRLQGAAHGWPVARAGGRPVAEVAVEFLSALAVRSMSGG